MHTTHSFTLYVARDVCYRSIESSIRLTSHIITHMPTVWLDVMSRQCIEIAVQNILKYSNPFGLEIIWIIIIKLSKQSPDQR